MTMQPEPDYPAVKVHLASAEPGIMPAAASSDHTHAHKAVYRTIVLTASDNGKEIFAVSETRCCAYVRALDDDLVIGKTSSDSQDSGRGYTVPKADTGPTPIYDSAVAYVGNATGTFSGSGSTSRLSVAAYYRA